jgi:hypothetical protein
MSNAAPTHCAHCGGPLTDLDPSYLGLALHRACYGIVTNQPVDNRAQHADYPGQRAWNPSTLFVKAP